MIDIDPLRDTLAERITIVRSLIDETHPEPPNVGAISREARGLAIVLLFAAYENLLTTLNRTLLECVIRMRVSNRRLRPGFRTFAVHSAAVSLRDSSGRKLFTKTLPDIVAIVDRGGRSTSIDPNVFPDDGSFMKRSQIVVWCELFDVGHPGALLSRTWNNIDGIVAQRNGIAHGRLTPQEVGRNYTESEIRQLVDDWLDDWNMFLDHVGQLASSRDFFRKPR
ncbi:hypothetical protein [Mycolicibacterium grossiae]|uniref:hypothetical protein n=1 Tax=Mycolicibacterium grossiae TaxID=1552759 RepID=UPI000F792532|nr:hypothetical protein [Mycolicibacterium grossiae]QEM45758.1 hypothetical protein FZ046_14225 [Mycolicibacterium grossiae]